MFFLSGSPLCCFIISLCFLLGISAVNITSTPKPKAPTAPQTRQYMFNVTKAVLSPDNFQKTAWTVNSIYPGTEIVAFQNDTIKVIVYNSLPNSEGTSIHWHGMLQKGTPWFDGGVGVTQCPIPSGKSFTYEFVAADPGTYWWHSHHRSQAVDGLLGSLIVHDPNDPHLSLYDEEFTVILDNWYHTEGSILIKQNSDPNLPPLVPDSILINGGTATQFHVAKGKRYRLRIINASPDGLLTFSVDNHALKVIEIDGYNVNPYTTHWIETSPGQRYSAIIECNQTLSDYYIRVQLSELRSSDTRSTTAILHYINSTTVGLPASSAWDSSQTLDSELSLQSNDTAPSSYGTRFIFNLDIHHVDANNASSSYLAYINNSSFLPDENYSTLNKFYDNYSQLTAANQNLYTLNKSNEVIEIVIINLTHERHPFHLHGHKFWIIGFGNDTNNLNTAQFNTKNLVQRDTARIPPTGYSVFRFTTGNPGVWGFHCHIDWHYAMGMGVQFLELPSLLKTYTPPVYVSSLCTKTPTKRNSM